LETNQSHGGELLQNRDPVFDMKTKISLIAHGSSGAHHVTRSHASGFLLLSAVGVLQFDPTLVGTEIHPGISRSINLQHQPSMSRRASDQPCFVNRRARRVVQEMAEQIGTTGDGVIIALGDGIAVRTYVRSISMCRFRSLMRSVAAFE
jgi:hypothetical protein